MRFDEFLKLTNTLKMLYGRDIAEKFFTKNIHLYYDLNSESIISIKKVEITS